MQIPFIHVILHAFRCIRTESPLFRTPPPPPACNLPIRIIRTPYRFIPLPLWPMLWHWRGTIWPGDIWTYCTIQYNAIFASSTHKNTHLLHINNIFYTIIDDAGGIWSQLDRLPMPPVFYSKHGAGQGTVMGGGDKAWVSNIVPV